MKRFLWIAILSLLIVTSNWQLAYPATKRISNAANIEDAQIATGIAADYNYGGKDQAGVGNSPALYTILRFVHLADTLGPGVTITAASCSLYFWLVTTAGTVDAFRMFKHGNEGTLNGSTAPDSAFGKGLWTFNDWSSQGEEWTTPGCQYADDAGSDNEGDGTGADRTATPFGSMTVSGVGWYKLDLPTSLVQGWYDGTYAENGILLNPNGTVKVYPRTSESAYCPILTITYTTGNRRRILMTGEN